MPAAVLVLPKSGYQNDDFLAAARKLGLTVIAASDACHQLAEHWQSTAVTWKAHDPAEAAAEIEQGLKGQAPAAVLGVDDRTALIAALTAARLGLPHNPPEAVAAARSKAMSRTRLREAGVPVPRFQLFNLDSQDLEQLLASAPYPCVAKPLSLSASRGVIRADNPQELRAAIARIARLLKSPDVAQRREADLKRLIIEEFIPGREIALEGLLQEGKLRVLALFDKPDPLDGPFFEETLYVTPSRHPPALQAQVAQSVSDGCRALGLVEGPIHAELRLSPQGPRILEIAARSIGGLCGRALRFGVGVTLEELVLRHALGLPAAPQREDVAAGVLMLPIRARGTLTEVRGVEEAKQVPLIEDVVITAHLREELVPLPEGASYFGFAFARGETPQAVEAALRAAGEQVRAVVTPRLPIT
ncbi:MAG TPA: ATP-grasp domain-containing protein [Myxococcales bacterium]|jgi:biotin carboxylase|nr:ATP-grasp domain-containing protein [Myxococcales bacterium]